MEAAKSKTVAPGKWNTQHHWKCSEVDGRSHVNLPSVCFVHTLRRELPLLERREWWRREAASWWPSSETLSMRPEAAICCWFSSHPLQFLFSFVTQVSAPRGSGGWDQNIGQQERSLVYLAKVVVAWTLTSCPIVVLHAVHAKTTSRSIFAQKKNVPCKRGDWCLDFKLRI